jgi:hypothetical protein
MQPPEAPISGKPQRTARILRMLLRITLIVVITWGWGWVLNKSARGSEMNATAAGFGRGMLHGALMPGAMPSLLFGKDVVIYAGNNNGRLYKLGYTFGVNACGAFFFGTFFYRLRKLKNWRKND